MSHKILIADDEPNILISLEYLMKREGYQVSVARDGLEALEALQRERPHLVLLDVMMPRKTGFEVCQALRADDALKDTLVLMLTAKGRDTDVAKGLALGADAYMTKPFSTKELVLKVRDLLQGAGAGNGPA
jgi:DNA-binding response OmpR family regulator